MTTTTEQKSEPKLPQSLFRPSLRALMGLVLILAVGLGVFLQLIRIRRNAATAQRLTAEALVQAAERRLPSSLGPQQ